VTLGSGALAPFPFVGWFLVEVTTLRERVHEEGVDTLANAGAEEGRSFRGHPFSEVEPPRSNFVRGVLRHSVVEAPDIAVAVFLVGGLVPDFTNPVRHSGGHRLANHKPVQNLVTLRLREAGRLPIHEDFPSLRHAGEAVLQSVSREIQIQGLRVLFHQTEGRAFEHRNLHAIRAEEAEEPDIQSDLETAIEGVLNHNLEAGHIALAHSQFDIGEAELSPNLPTLVDDFEPLGFISVTRGAKEGFKLREQDAVLHRRVTLAHDTKDIARVLADGGEGRGGSPVGEVESLEADLEVHAVERVHDFEGFGFIVRIDHMFLVTVHPSVG